MSDIKNLNKLGVSKTQMNAYLISLSNKDKL